MMNDQAGRHPRELLSPFLDGELGPDEQTGVAIHLEGCAACRGLLDDLRILAAGIAAEEPPVPPADLAARIGRRVGALPGGAKVMPIRRTVWRSPLVQSSVAAALAGIIVTVVWFSADRPPLRREEGVVVAQAPAPPPERDRMAESRMTAASTPARESGAADQDARGADDEAPPGVGMQKEDVAADAPASAPSPPERRDAAGGEQAAAEPIQVTGNEAGEAPGQASAEPGDLPAGRARRASPDSRDAGDAAGAALSPASAAPSLLQVVDAPRARALELLNSDFRAVLSEDGALSFRAGAYECVVPAGSPAQESAPQTRPVDTAGAVEPGPEVQEIFALAAAEHARRAAAATGEGSGSAGGRGVAVTGESRAAGGSPAMVLIFRDENDSPLYRETLPADRSAAAASSTVPVAARLGRLIREHYLPLMEGRCGPLPPALQMEDSHTPE